MSLELDLDDEGTPIGGEIEPLADCFGELLLRLLRRNGWEVFEPVRAFAGGHLLIARKHGLEVSAAADTFAAAASALTNRAVAELGRLDTSSAA